MSDKPITGRARRLGPAAGLVRHKHDGAIVRWEGPAELYLLTPALRGYSTVVLASYHANPGADVALLTRIFGLEGEGLLLDWHEVGSRLALCTASEALADAGYATI